MRRTLRMSLSAGSELAALSVPGGADWVGGNRNLLWSERHGGLGLGLFSALWLLIGMVSAYDTYLTVRYQETLMVYECNPVAIWLLEYDKWNPATLVALKFLGSMIVLGVLTLSYWWRPRWATLMTLSIALVQLSLLVFLTIG